VNPSHRGKPRWTAEAAVLARLAKQVSQTPSCPNCKEEMVATRFHPHTGRHSEGGQIRHRYPTRIECDSCELFVDVKDVRMWG
jgi:hypothetical protein